MASNLDLEEQEQLDQIKHLWAKYGNLITWLLIAVLGAYAAWNGWQWWERRAALQATAVYDEMEKAVKAGDTARVERTLTDIQSQFGGTVQAQHGALLAARALHEAGKADAARQALAWAVDKGGDESLVAVARLRLAGLDIDAKAYDKALQWLDKGIPAEFAALAADRRGDALLAQGQRDAAKAAYQQAYDGLKPGQDYRRMVEAKLNALGVAPPAASPATGAAEATGGKS